MVGPLLVLLALLVPAARAGAGHQIHFRRLSTNDGLSEGSINAIAQDRDGFLWFGTQDGLNRYDGYDFKIFRHDAGDSSSISDAYVWCITPARDGDLWIGTLHGGLDKCHRSRGTFQHFQYSPGDPGGIPGNDVTCVLVDSRGTLWVGTWGGGLAYLDSLHQRFVSFRHRLDDPQSLPDNRVRCLWEDSSGTIWIGTFGGLAFVTKGRIVVPPRHLPPEIISIGSDRRNNVFVGTNGQGVAIVERDGALRSSPGELGPLVNALKGRVVGFVHEDLSGRYWAGTYDGGLISWLPGQEGVISFLSSPSNPEGVPSSNVSSVFEDADGGLWLGTYGDGIRRFDRRWERFQSYRSDLPSSNGLTNGNVRAVVSDRRGRIWVGTEGGGLFEFTRTSGRFMHYPHVPGHEAQKFGDRIIALAGDPGGRLWIGTGGEGLISWSPESGQWEKYENDPGSLAGNVIYALCRDHRGVIWVGTLDQGLDMLDPVTHRRMHYLPSAANPNSLSGSTVYSLFEDRAGNLWIGTWGRGLTVLDSTRTQFTRFMHDPADSTSLGSNTILCCAEDDSGTIWIGTQGGGLERYDSAQRGFVHFTDKNGLPNNVVNSILADRRARLWISTNHGICSFDLRTRVFSNFDVLDGLQNNEFNGGSSATANDGSMYFGGIEGLTVFHPDSIQPTPWNPPVLLTGFRIFDRPVHFDRPTSEKEDIELNYAENFFSFEFVALDFFNPQKTLYRYRMEGFDRDWVNAGARRYASYTHLDPGSYVFRVNASSTAGMWDETGAAVRIRIVPPYWQTWWFRVAAGVVILGLLAALYQRRVGALKRDRRLQQEFSSRLMESQENERKRIAGELHDSLGQNLLVIRNRALMGLKDESLGKQARDQFDQISSVATQAIDEVRGISYGLRPYQLDRLGLTKAIGSITSGLASTVRFAMQLDPIDDEVGKEGAIHVYRIVQEGINNILKHGDATDAKVEIRVEGSRLRIVIEDNGKGMPALPGANGTGPAGGLGLVGIAERAKILNGTMTIESKAGEGTTLTVVIPRAGGTDA